MVQKGISLMVLALASRVVADTSSAQRASICRVVEQLKDPKSALEAAEWLLKQSVPFSQLQGPLSDPLLTVLEQYKCAAPRTGEKALFLTIITKFLRAQRFDKDILTQALFDVIQLRYYSLTLIRLLLNHGADPNGMVTYKRAGCLKRTTLFLMVIREAFFSQKDRKDWVSVIKELLAYGADLDELPRVFDEFKAPPFPLFALTAKRLSILRLLFTYGMDHRVLKSNIVTSYKGFFADLATALIKREQQIKHIEEPYVPRELWRLIHLFEYDQTLCQAKNVPD